MKPAERPSPDPADTAHRAEQARLAAQAAAEAAAEVVKAAAAELAVLRTAEAAIAADTPGYRIPRSIDDLSVDDVSVDAAEAPDVETVDRAAERAARREQQRTDKQERREAARAARADRAERRAAERAARRSEREPAAAAIEEESHEEPQTFVTTELEPVAETESDRVDADEPGPAPAARPGSARRVVGLIGSVLAMVAVVLSVLLAVGALLAATSAGDDGAVRLVASVCDALTTPLHGIVNIGGASGPDRELLVERGIGSVVFLAIGLALPVLLARSDDADD